MKKLAIAMVIAAASSLVTAVHVQAEDECNDTKWTWPFCHMSKPSIPRFNLGGGRPPLTSKDSAWCRQSSIKVNKTGTIYWLLKSSTKHDLTFWPDYYHRVYQAIYWTGRAWAFVPVNNSYPNIPLSETVDCDA